jgi:hypothetical protein
LSAVESSREQEGLDARGLAAQFEHAADRAGQVSDQTYRIGGQNLRLRFAGGALRDRLSPSIEHLRLETGGVDEHVIEIWDGASTGTEPPPAPAGTEGLPPGGIATGSGEGWRAIFEADVRSLSVIDEPLNRSWYWATDADRLPEWNCSTPLRHLLHLQLASHGVQFVHAGAVGRPDGGVIIVGRSGSGKSTSTLSTLGSDLLYAGDDYVGVSLGPAGGQPYVYSIYGCGKLETDHMARFPGLEVRPRPERPGTPPAAREKTIFYVRDTYPHQLTSGFPLKAIIVPRVVPGEKTELTDIPLTTALRALIPSTMFEIHGAGQQALSILTRVAQRVRTLELRLGADIGTVPELLDRRLGELDSVWSDGE